MRPATLKTLQAALAAAGDFLCPLRGKLPGYSRGRISADVRKVLQSKTYQKPKGVCDYTFWDGEREISGLAPFLRLFHSGGCGNLDGRAES